MITHLDLATADLAPLRDFYTQTLGLPLVDTASESFSLGVGATRLTFAQSRTAYRYHFAFSLPMAQFDSALVWIKARTPTIVDNAGTEVFEFTDWSARAFYFYDSAGNILEFIARHRKTDEASQTFTPQGLTSVCEIGLATLDVLATVHRLQTELGLTVFDGEGSDTFTAVGKPSGLFIVVKQDRPWKPDTGVPATLNPLQVRLANSAELRQMDGILELSAPVLP